MPVSFDGQYDRASLARAVALARPTSWQYRLLISLPLMLVVAFLAREVVGYVLSPQPLVLAWVIRWLFLLLITGYLALLPEVTRRSLVSQLARNPLARERLAGLVNEHGIELIGPENRRFFPWQAFAFVRRKPDLVVLTTADGTVVALPRRFFTSDDAWREFLQYVDYRVVIAK